MRMAYRLWPYSSIVLAVAGVVLIGMGFYFILLRPPLLPEDVRYMDLPAAQLDAVRPHLGMWLTRVFSVMGGYIVATGVLTITVAATSFRAHDRIAVAGALAAGIASIGWMAVVNFGIASDFKWVLLGVALVWACSLVLFWFERAVGGGR
jgi:drug/metabolite transporter (DMT)-like permease